MAKKLSKVLFNLAYSAKRTEKEMPDLSKASAVFVGVLTKEGYLRSYSWTETHNVVDIISILANGMLTDISNFEIAKALIFIHDEQPDIFDNILAQVEARVSTNQMGLIKQCMNEITHNRPEEENKISVDFDTPIS